MNTIALQIDYATQELKMHNDLMDARDECRRLEAARSNTVAGSNRAIANMKYINALAKVQRLQREYDDMFAPAEGVK